MSGSAAGRPGAARRASRFRRHLGGCPWANALTLLRLLLAPGLAIALHAGAARLAAALFALACASDLVDGPLARRLGTASERGGFFDHVADATFVTTGLAVLAARGVVPVLLPVLVPLAFLQYVLDSRALQGRALRASALGRWNGVAYFVLLGVPVVRDALGLEWPAHFLVRVAGWLLVATTLLSIAQRARLRGFRGGA